MALLRQKKYTKKSRIPLRTIKDNLKKLREHRRGNGRSVKVTQTITRAIGQHVRKNNAISTRGLATKIQASHNTAISHVTVWNHMKKKGL
jgi:hypothetical protein